MSDQWTERLSEYLDGEMQGSERAFLEAHLERCDECQETLAGLRRVVMRARSLEDRPPATDLDPQIANGVGEERDLAARPQARDERVFRGGFVWIELESEFAFESAVGADQFKVERFVARVPSQEDELIAFEKIRQTRGQQIVNPAMDGG